MAKKSAKAKSTDSAAAWEKAEQILAAKKAAFKAGKIEGYVFNGKIAPLVEKFEAGGRSDDMLADILAL
jgi:hypothetical protein